ncbi:hypothetical protein QFZ22_004988 [Streptomyces canus]|uniref:Uncharacterized protein n=1 Tax=Streptomyces canus TaxID=58343 RepID=A0AAW8FHK8_9ACTN|nr:hypothetical protein [Streptomyces canus]
MAARVRLTGRGSVRRDADLPVITSAAVLVEVIHPEIDEAVPTGSSRLRVSGTGSFRRCPARVGQWAVAMR